MVHWSGTLYIFYHPEISRHSVLKFGLFLLSGVKEGFVLGLYFNRLYIQLFV
jgi:hypothetical protein